MVYGAVRWRSALGRRAVVCAIGLMFGYGLLTVIPPPLLMAGVMVLTGLFLGPLLTVTLTLIGDLAPRGTATEAFAWRITLFACGSSLGSAAGGAVLDRTDLHWAAACGVLGVGGCLLTLLLGHRILATPDVPPDSHSAHGRSGGDLVGVGDAVGAPHRTTATFSSGIRSMHTGRDPQLDLKSG